MQRVFNTAFILVGIKQDPKQVESSCVLLHKYSGKEPAPFIRITMYLGKILILEKRTLKQNECFGS